MLDALDKDEPIPDYEETARKLRSGQNLVEQLTIGDWLDRWQAQESHRRATELSYESHVRLYLKPKIGDVRVDRLTVSHISEMFAKINDDNDRIVANNDDRRALKARIKNTRSRAEKSVLRAQLDELEPFRRPVGPTSQARIHATLRAAMNDAITEQKTTFNAAMHYTVSAKKPKPLVWTPERVEEWQRTGKRPGPVMVWTPEQAGIFLDYVAVHDRDWEALWHLAVKRGPRRGELAGLRWTEYSALDANVTISTQLTEVDWEVVEGEPKSEAGERVVPLDEETNQHFRTRKARQAQRRLELGPAWVDSGRVFTLEDGSALRPSSISDRFELLREAAGLPPIRLHDLRHTAATLMLAADIDMKVIQETLGHSQIQTTANLYTSVLPKVARDAAEKTTALIPRTTARAPSNTLGHPSGTHKIHIERLEVAEMVRT